MLSDEVINYNTSNLHTKFSTQNSLSVYPFIKLWKNSFCRVLVFICDSTPPSGTATSIAMPIFSSQCHTSLHHVASLFLPSSSVHHANRQCSPQQSYTRQRLTLIWKAVSRFVIRPRYYYSYYASYRTTRAQKQCKHQHTSWTASR